MITRFIFVVFFITILLTGGMYLSPGTAPVVATSPETGSMEPTISPSDVVILYGWQEPRVGDVILFESDVEDSPVLHRVVDVTDSGYITQGDANEVTDQDGDFSPVTRDQIYGVVIGGDEPYTIPTIGLILSNTLLLMMLWLVLLVINIVPETQRHNRAILTQNESSIIILFLVLILLISLPMFTYFTMETAEVSVTTVNSPSEISDNIVAIGETGTDRVPFIYTSTLITEPYVVVDSNDLHVTETQYEDGILYAVISNTPQDTIGVQTGSVSLYTYVGILPTGVVFSLIEIHYLLPSIIDAILISTVLLFLWYILMRGRHRRSKAVIYKKRRYMNQKLK